MEEEPIHAIPFVVDAQAALSSDKSEIVARFEEEGLEVTDEGVLKVALGIPRERSGGASSARRTA